MVLSFLHFPIRVILNLPTKIYIHSWLGLTSKASRFTFRFKSKDVCLLCSFSIHCWALTKLVPPDPWRSLLNSFSNGSVECCPSSTYLWLVGKKCRDRLKIPLQVVALVVEVRLDNCFIWLPRLLPIIRAIGLKSIKSSRLSFGHLILASWGSLFCLSI